MGWANVLLFVLAAVAAAVTVFKVFPEYLGIPFYSIGLMIGITCLYRTILVFAEVFIGGLVAARNKIRSGTDQNQTPP